MNVSAVSILSYLIASVCFIVGLKRLSSPRTAVSGNSIAAVGMLIAIVTTLLQQQVIDYTGIIAGLLLGAALGALLAQRGEMTSMPELVAAFNGFGGAASMLVASAELVRYATPGSNPGFGITAPIVLGTVIGAVTVTGSFIAYAKLREVMAGSPITFPGQQPFNILLGLGLLALAGAVVVTPSNLPVFWGLVGLACLLGVLLVIPIGGADMPVVISRLNSYSGLAACATGFVISNQGLIICGSLVGASGIILTQIMCKAMNRSLANVLFGAFGAAAEAVAEDPAKAAQGSVKSGSSEDAAMILDAARSVVIVPGYGLAVAQAQHAVRKLSDALMDRGVEVRYGIHPVAGRMPGHMNVLLAEADVPYELLIEMEEINLSMPRTDVALVIGANDVTNPAAREDPSSPIYGMPILDVDRCKTVIVSKRSMNPGFAGIGNPLYTLDQAMMLFGDAKGTVEGITAALREL